MKRWSIVAIGVLLIAGSMAQPAMANKKKKPPAPKKVERQATSDYQAPAIGFPEATWVCFRPTNSCGDIPIGGEEYYVKIEIADGSGTATAFALGQDTDPSTVGTDTDYGNSAGPPASKPSRSNQASRWSSRLTSSAARSVQDLWAQRAPSRQRSRTFPDLGTTDSKESTC